MVNIIMLNLEMKGMKAGGDKAFVKKSASCSLDEIGNKWSTPS